MTLAPAAFDLPLPARAPREEPCPRPTARPQALWGVASQPTSEPWPTVWQIGCHAALFPSGGHYGACAEG